MNDVTKATPASFEPTIDYIVTKIPRFAFEKFPGADNTLTTAMKSVGESMAMGRNFPESLQKALRSLETGLNGLDAIEIPGASTENLDPIRSALTRPTPERLLQIGQALRFGMSEAEICRITKYDPWFIAQLKRIIDAKNWVKANGLPKAKADLHQLKSLGFSDKQLAKLTGKNELDVRKLRHKQNVRPVFKRVDTCAGEFASLTPYMYSCYEGDGETPAESEVSPTDRKKIFILGGGPNRIGQGIEFDYCCVHAAYALKDAGYETIMINCNPETVSTDYDTSDRLYFEPLTAEDVIEIIEAEKQNGTVVGAIVQFGGQTPLKLAHALEQAGVPIIGTSVDSIDLAEDRERFQQLLHKLELKQPANAICKHADEVVKQAEKIGYPVVVRPSYVLGGRAMKIIHDPETLKSYVHELLQMFGDGPVLLDSYLQDAIELDVDCLSDGKTFFVAGIMEHIEEAGIHSGDSACSLPPYSLPDEIIDEVRRQTIALAGALNVRGLMNVQFAVKDGVIYIIEVNPRASRTTPFVAKATGIQIAKIAARLMAGEALSSFNLPDDKTHMKQLGHVAVKEAVFPFARFPGVDTLLGPEMKSTGESMGIDRNFAAAFGKGFIGAGSTLPKGGIAFLSVKDRDKQMMATIAQDLLTLGFKVICTRGTGEYLQQQALPVEIVNKVHEGRPHIVDLMKDGKIHLVINTTEGAQAISDSSSIRRTALFGKIPYSTTMSGARAMVQAIGAIAQTAGGLSVTPLQAYVSKASAEKDAA